MSSTHRDIDGTAKSRTTAHFDQWDSLSLQCSCAILVGWKSLEIIRFACAKDTAKWSKPSFGQWSKLPGRAMAATDSMAEGAVSSLSRAGFTFVDVVSAGFV